MNRQDFKKFCSLYTKAERYIKFLERKYPEQGALIPAINELRYARKPYKANIAD